MKADDLAYVALALAPGVGRSRFDALVERFETPEEVLRASTKDLITIHGIGLAAATTIRGVDVAKAERIVERVEGLGGRVVLPGDPLFPESLKTIPEAARILGVSEDFVRRRTKGPNKLPFIIHMGRRVLCSSKGMLRYIERQQRDTG